MLFVQKWPELCFQRLLPRVKVIVVFVPKLSARGAYITVLFCIEVTGVYFNKFLFGSKVTGVFVPKLSGLRYVIYHAIHTKTIGGGGIFHQQPSPTTIAKGYQDWGT